MVHKLLIDAGIDLLEPIDARYKELLRDFEIVRGVNTRFRFRIRNIGETNFPGGELARRQITFVNLLGAQIFRGYSTPSSRTIPALKPKEAYVIQTQYFSQISGVMTVTLKIISNDKAKVEHYQNEEFPPSDEWFAAVTVLDRENLDELVLLREIIKKGK